ncbi:MAG: HlyD family efflux transporter periplasmic adaptor subunit [Magnetococcales bacterium]|nr:HlyD family efflux transporter periplasmic adaptor subunit [Magnetococcales bacterium]
MVPQATADPQATIAALLNLQQKLLTAPTAAEFGFLAVNALIHLLPYRQAALWQLSPGGERGTITAISGLPVVNPEAPYIQWLTSLLRHLSSQHPTRTTLTADQLPAAMAASWQAWLPEHALWLPLQLPGNSPSTAPPHWLGGLLLVRAEPWSEAEQQLLAHLGLTMAPAWWGLLTRHRLRDRLWAQRPPTVALFGLLLAALLLSIPVQQSVLAPAEVVAFQPAVIRAPLDGVVDAFHVLPNQSVQAGAVLLNLDTTQLTNRLEITRKEWEVAQTEYRQAVQGALQEPKSKAKLALLRGRVQQKEADLNYIRAQLERVTVVAPRDGIAVYSDENDWVGRPVHVGERLMVLADPAQVELEIRLPVADAILLQPGTAVTLFPATDGSRTLAAQLRYASYQADLTPEGVLAYTLRARFAAGEPLPRLGLRGTAKLIGAPVRLFHYLLRRPWAAARQLLGL